MSRDKKTMKMMSVKIDYLDSSGVGVGSFDDRKVFVPYSIPEEYVEARVVKQNKHAVYTALEEIVVPSVSRVEPICSHFGMCGGCKLQHLDHDYYVKYRSSVLEDALYRGGFVDAKVTQFIKIPPQSRRKIRLKVKVGKHSVKLGFYMLGEYKVVDVNECWVALPEIAALFSPLRELIMEFERSQRVTDVVIFKADNGVMVSLYSEASIEKKEESLISQFCEENKVIHFSWYHDNEERVVCEMSLPFVTIGEVKIPLQGKGFSQATQEGVSVITELVCKHVEEAESVLDLYAGYGTYSLPLVVKGKSVRSYEGSPMMVNTLLNSIAQYELSDSINAFCRDLFNQPIVGHEVATYDAVVINPPRNGAEPQVKIIAQSGINRVIMVSCDVKSLAKDIRYLHKAGYRLVASYVIDQFLWSGHIETVSVFEASC